MLNFKEKFVYGCARLGSSTSINMTDLFTAFAYYAFFGLENSPFLAFLGVAIGKLVIAVSSYLSGYFSDRLHSRWGRRRPFIIIGAPFMALVFFFLFTPYLWLNGVTNPYIIFGWLLFFNSLYQALYGIVLTPFQAWLPEIANEKEWLVVSGYQNTFNLLAFVIGAGTAFLLPAFLGKNPDFSASNKIFPFLTNSTIFTFFVILFTLGIVVFFIPAIILIKAKEIFIPQPTFKEELKVVLSNKNFLGWVFSRGVLAIMISGLIGIVLAWITDVLDFTTLNYILFGLILLSSIFVFLIFWVKFGNAFGKTKSFIVSMTYLGCIMPIMSIIGVIQLPISLFTQGVFFALLAAAGLASYYLLPYAIVADIIREDEKLTGESRAGIYYGFEAIPLNFFQFLGYLLVGLLLELPKYTNYTGRVFSEGYILFGLIFSLFIFVSVIIFWRFVNADPS